MSYSISQNSKTSFMPALFQLNHNTFPSQQVYQKFVVNQYGPRRFWVLLFLVTISMVYWFDHGIYNSMIWLSQIDIHWNFLVFLCNQQPIYHVYWICFEKIIYNVMIIFKTVIKVNYLYFNKFFPMLKNKQLLLLLFYTRRNVSGMSRRHCFFLLLHMRKSFVYQHFLEMSIPLKSRNHFNFSAPNKCRFLFKPIILEHSCKQNESL